MKIPGTASRRGLRMSKKLFALGVAFAATVAFALPAQSQIRAYNVQVGVFTGRDGVSGFVDNVAPKDARYSGPSAVAGSATDLWIADTNNNRIRRLLTPPASHTVSLTTDPNKVVQSTTPPPTVTTVAGTGVAGWSGDGGHPLQAQFNRPAGIAVCSYSHTTVIYVADSGNNRIRRIEIPKLPSSVTVTQSGSVTPNSTALVSTVAGTGVAGYSDGGGNPAQSMLNNPTKISCSNRSSDFTGLSGQSILFTDTNNHVLRTFAVNADGTVRPGMGIRAGTPGVRGFAGDGGPAPGSRLNFPTGYGGCDNSGGFMIADSGNNRIRVLMGDPSLSVSSTGATSIFPGTETIFTFAGTGVPGNRGDNGHPRDAQFNNPTDVVCSYGGNTSSTSYTVTILDSGNTRLRRVEGTQFYVVTTAPSAGPVSTLFTGTLVGAPGTPLGLKNTKLMSGTNASLLIADAGGHVVRQVSVG